MYYVPNMYTCVWKLYERPPPHLLSQLILRTHRLDSNRLYAESGLDFNVDESAENLYLGV